MIAAVHDRWNSEPVLVRLQTAAQFWWRHINRRHPTMVSAAEWSFAALASISMVLVELLANS